MRLTVTFLLVLCNTVSISQLPKYKQTRYSSLNGLPDNSITSIIQDYRGFLWIGTSEGLSRFDGTNFKNYFAKKNDTLSLPGNTIAYLNEYKPGHLLFQCGSELVMMNTITQQFSRFRGFKGKFVLGILPRNDSGYFIYSFDTCFIINKNIEIVDKIAPPIKQKNNAVIATPLDSNTLLTGSKWEYFLYSPLSKKYTSFIIPNNLPPEQRFFTFQYFDPINRTLYFSNYWGGIYQCSMNGDLLNHWADGCKEGLVNSNISFIKRKTGNNLWVGTLGGGFYIFNTSTNQFNKVFNSNDNPNAVIISHYTDKLKNEWVGTKEGLVKLSDISKLMNTWQEEFTGAGRDNSLLSIVEGADKQVYLSLLASDFVFRINKATGGVTKLKYLKIPMTWYLNNFGDKLVFTGAGTRVTKYNPVSGQYDQSDLLEKYFPRTETVIMALKHSNGDEWYSGNNWGGLLRVESNGVVHHYTNVGPGGRISINYYALYAEDKEGNLWFGVNKTSKILKWNKATDQFSEVLIGTIRGTEGLAFAGVNDLTFDSQDNLWIAFDGTGIVKYDVANNTTVHYTIENGLPTNYIFSLKFDGKNRLWVGTPKGLGCLDVQEKRYVNFTREDGLPDDVFNERCIYYDSSENRMWVGGHSALVRFCPDTLLSITKNDIPVYLDEILVNGVNQHPGDTSLTYYKPSQTNFLFRFTGLDMNNGKFIEYSYKLDGADKDWVYSSSNPIALYPNLNPGKYAFTVRARHKGENGWMTMQNSYSFIILTPWFNTWWFRLLAVLSLGIMVWYVIRNYYIRKMEKQKRLIDKELTIQEERTRVARELHDGLGSMLSGIKHSFSAMANQLMLGESQQLLFHSNIDKLNESINELRNISHSMASGSLLVNDLESALKDYCQNLQQMTGIEISFTALNTQNIQLAQDERFHCFRIIQELLQNIISHSGAAHAILQISYNNNRLYIAVEDNGKGFEMHTIKQKKGIGLKNIETRIKILKGQLDYQTAPLKGTSVLIEIPCSERSS